MKKRLLMIGLFTLFLAQQSLHLAAAESVSGSSFHKSRSSLTLDALNNAEYLSEFAASGKAQLNNGIYREKRTPESATELVITLLDVYAFGDLNGDGINDAAVVLVADPGGSGTFLHLAVVFEENEMPRHVATEFLGDRVKVKSVSIKAGEIAVEMIKHDPNDPMCCPTLGVAQKYALQGDALVQLPATTPSSSAPETSGEKGLLNKQWVLQSSGVSTSEERPIPNTNISLEFTSEGRLSGSGGCNRYFGEYKVKPGNSLTIRGIGSTRMACPPGIMDQEMRYFEALQNTSTFRLDAHRLKLIDNNGQQVLNLAAKPNPRW